MLLAEGGERGGRVGLEPSAPDLPRRVSAEAARGVVGFDSFGRTALIRTPRRACREPTPREESVA